MSSETLDVTATLTGKRVLFAGTTGFVGKVALSMLLHRYGDVLGQVYILARKGSAPSAERRVYDKIFPSEPFDPLREKYGGADGFAAFLKKRVSILDGDITDPWMGLPEETVTQLTGKVDAIINCAGLVSFNPSLELALNINTYGVKNAAELAKRWNAPLVHVSTSFVAGNRTGLIFEDEEIRGYFPKKDDLDGRDFSLEQELKDCERIVAQLREKADDKALTSNFRKAALERLEVEGRDANDEKTLRLAVGRERKLWLTGELIKAGMDRAEHWGWPNTYTYTKSLGEQALASTEGIRYAIVRPSIVESALRYPMPGWNEGFTTSAPLSFAGIKNGGMLPAGEKTILDIIPVDEVAGSLIAVTAAVIKGSTEKKVFQQASGDVNPFFASRSVELVGLYKRRYMRSKKAGNQFLNSVRSKIEPVPVNKQTFDLFSGPMLLKGAKKLRETIDEVKPKWGAPRLSALLDFAEDKLQEMEDEGKSLLAMVELFMPFLWQNRYVFRCDNLRAIYATMRPEDRALIPWAPEEIDWRIYFLEVHLPGLERFVFPGLEEESERRAASHTYRDLVELFEASVHAYRHRVAFRMVEGEKEERFSYGETHRYATRVAAYLKWKGVQKGDRVLLMGENRPEWGICYFGILLAGATAVPLDAELSLAEVSNVAKSARPAFALMTEDTVKELGDVEKALTSDGVNAKLASFAEAMTGNPTELDRVGTLDRKVSSDDVASLIFTSGTTGTPKGVMLTHRNFAALVSKLTGAFELRVGDGLLSVLPLHHTFEFSCGFLLPFSRGAEVTYIDELTSDRLGDVFETGRVTAMIGVPALWQLLHRKITQEFAARPAFVEQGIRALMGAHGELRNRTDVNLGKLLFWPVHRKFGGRMRFLVSGGSALPDEVHKAFHALGFNIAEGYGLTEAAPVLTVQAVQNEREPGSVGRALPGIELKILNPNDEGVGEVVARGPNVMQGYFENREATEAVLKEGWLHTGDLGRIDADGKLYLSGRAKEVIIDANGKNVFPDELEELYRHHAHIKELSVVGLPDDAGGEKVACLVVPDYKDRPRGEVKKEIEEHFKRASAEIPFYRRVKVLRFTDVELPKTSTRKVKRKLVVEELRKVERALQSGEKVRQVASASPAGGTDWLIPLIADVVQKPAAEVRPDAELVADLGFDSLLLTELAVALEQAGVPLPNVSDLSQVGTVEDLRKLVAATGRRPAAEIRARDISKEAEAEGERELPVPTAVASLGTQLLAFGQKILYGGVFDVKVTGKNFIPQNRNFIVAANHASHLDMGLVKVVLGEQGDKLTALAARDYFFDTPLKRAYFENFTNLIPMDRSGSLRESLRLAGEALRQGYNLLIFPEGTRSQTGELAEFKNTLGYLALTFNVDILPLYLKGTYEVLPKGSIFPKGKELEARLGPVIEADVLKRKVAGLPKSDGYKYATRLAEESVKSLRDGRAIDVMQGDVVPLPEKRVRKEGGAT